MKKAILINVNEKSITEVLIEEGIKPMYELIGCRAFDVAQIENDDDVYVDDEGMFSKENFFIYEGAHQPFAGNGLILGINHDNGESIDTTLTVEQVKAKVKFYTLEEIRGLLR